MSDATSDIMPDVTITGLQDVMSDTTPDVMPDVTFDVTSDVLGMMDI